MREHMTHDRLVAAPVQCSHVGVKNIQTHGAFGSLSTLARYSAIAWTHASTRGSSFSVLANCVQGCAGLPTSSVRISAPDRILFSICVRRLPSASSREVPSASVANGEPLEARYPCPCLGSSRTVISILPSPGWATYTLLSGYALGARSQGSTVL